MAERESGKCISTSTSYIHTYWTIKTAANKGFAASVAGRKNNRQFYKAKLQFGQDKQLWASNLNFNKQF